MASDAGKFLGGDCLAVLLRIDPHRRGRGAKHGVGETRTELGEAGYRTGAVFWDRDDMGGMRARAHQGGHGHHPGDDGLALHASQTQLLTSRFPGGIVRSRLRRQSADRLVIADAASYWPAAQAWAGIRAAAGAAGRQPRSARLDQQAVKLCSTLRPPAARKAWPGGRGGGAPLNGHGHGRHRRPQHVGLRPEECD